MTENVKLEVRIYEVKRRKSGEKQIKFRAMYSFDDVCKLTNIIELLNSISDNKIELK